MISFFWISWWSARANFSRPSAARQAHAFSPRRHAASWSPADRAAADRWLETPIKESRGHAWKRPGGSAPERRIPSQTSPVSVHVADVCSPCGRNYKTQQMLTIWGLSGRWVEIARSVKHHSLASNPAPCQSRSCTGSFKKTIENRKLKVIVREVPRGGKHYLRKSADRKYY